MIVKNWKILPLAPSGALALFLTSLIIAPLTLHSVLAESDVTRSNGTVGDITGTPQKNPILAAEGNNVYILWTGNLPNNTKTFFIRSEDGGLTFATPIQLADNVLSSLSMSASGDNVYLVWDDPSQEPYDVHFRRSTDGGTNFGPPVNLTDNAGFSRNPKIASYGSNVYVAWFDNIPSLNRNELFLRASNNNGTTFGQNVKLSDSAVDSDILISAVKDSVYVVWQDLNAEKYHIMFAVSNDSGKSFREFKLNGDNSNLAFLGSISAIDSDVYVAWYERIGEFGSHILFRGSHDNGGSFGSVLTLSSDIPWDILTVDVPVTVASEIPKVVSLGDDIYVMWRDGYVNGTADLVLRSSKDKGFTFGDISRISRITGPYPQMDASGSNSYLVWENSNSTNSDIYLANIGGNGNILNVQNVSKSPGHSASPQLIAHGKEAFVIWTDYTDSSRFGEIFYAKSVDGEVIGRLRITYDSLIIEANNNYNIELQPFVLATILDNKNYTVLGRSQNVTVKTFTIYPNWGISIQLTPQDKDGVVELALPKNIIDGMQHVDITIDDFTLARDFDQLNGNSTHTTVNFVVPAGTRQIEIKGTQVVPEFEVAIAIAGIAFLTIIATRVQIWKLLKRA